MGSEFVTIAQEVPTKGTVTWDSEGSEGGKWHSRKPHVPSDSSGLTIGRGYDMKSRSASEVLIDLIRAGVPRESAEKLSKGAGLKGDVARKYIKDAGLADFELTHAAQKKLFEIAYDAEASEAKRLATKDDVKKKYGATDWDKLDPAIQEMLVDLKFRGDYTPGAREKIQKHVVANDLAGFSKVLTDPKNWPNVPADRFKRRKKFIEEAVARRKLETKVEPRRTKPFGG